VFLPKRRLLIRFRFKETKKVILSKSGKVALIPVIARIHY